MKNFLSATIIVLFSTFNAHADCFIAKEGEKTLVQEGKCAERYSPCSTFKIPLSLFGFEDKILIDEKNPKWDFKEGYADFLDVWKQSYTPDIWLKNSCVWYSQELTQKMGMKKFSEYVNTLNYGNKDVSGDKGKNNGLTHSWLSSSLKISPLEQIQILEGLLNETWPFSKHSMDVTKKIMFLEDMPKNYKLYGKTGSGRIKDSVGKPSELQQGWFIGWVTNGQHTVTFVQYIQDTSRNDEYAGPRAKKIAKEKITSLLWNS
jgi:beta-lactamase class D